MTRPRPYTSTERLTTADYLAEALQLLDQLATWCPCADNGEQCANTDAHALLIRHGIRKEPTS